MARTDSHVRKMHQQVHINRFYHFILKFCRSTVVVNSFIVFLLGRAVILQSISPFAIAYIAALFISFDRYRFIMIMSALIGALTYSNEQFAFIALALVVYFSLYFMTHRYHHIRGFIYVFVFFSIAISRVFFFSLPSRITLFDSMQIFLECSMGLVLLYIFMQSIPLLFQKEFSFALISTEELICLVIFISSVITGLIGIVVYDFQLEHILARFLILLFAFMGGASIGALVGVVIGVILTLANVANLFQISLLAFAGLLGGMLKDWGKQGVALGLLAGTLLLGMYDGVDKLLVKMMTTFIATAIFFIFPQTILKKAAKYIPGSVEYRMEERQYIKKIRHVTAERVERFSAVFAALANSFIPATPVEGQGKKETETDYLLSSMTKKTCNHCFMKKHCWQKNFHQTYTLFEEMKDQLIETDTIDRSVLHTFKNHCVKSHQVVEILQTEAESAKLNRKLKRQVLESKKIVADQLLGVSDVMDKFAQEMVKERVVQEKLEARIIASLKKFHIPIQTIDVYSLEEGNVDIEIHCLMANHYGEAEKLIAPILTNILKEEIVLESVIISPIGQASSQFTFRSSRRYVMETGVATAAKDGGLVSGDSYTTTEMSKGKFAMAISDGMGNGMRANEESSETIRLLKKMLETGISEKVAIQSVNSILTLRTTDEIFSTLDLAIFNLYHAHVRFLKVSAMPSFIKRGDDVWQICANSLPMGMIEHVKLETVTEHLKPDDLIIMVSDGLFHRMMEVREQVDIMQELIRKMKTNKPQDIADVLLEETIRSANGLIADDMTVVVAKFKRHIPKWSAIEVDRFEAN